MSEPDPLPSPGPPARPPLRREPNPRQRILVVDDDPSLLKVNAEVLACSGYHVDAAADGAAAWDALQLNHYDLLVTDNNMPKLTGFELIQKLHLAGAALPVILATGAPPDEQVLRYAVAPPAATLLKPYTFDELLEAVKSVLRAASASLGAAAPPPNWPGQPLPGHPLR